MPERTQALKIIYRNLSEAKLGPLRLGELNLPGQKRGMQSYHGIGFIVVGSSEKLLAAMMPSGVMMNSEFILRIQRAVQKKFPDVQVIGTTVKTPGAYRGAVMFAAVKNSPLNHEDIRRAEQTYASSFGETQ